MQRATGYLSLFCHINAVIICVQNVLLSVVEYRGVEWCESSKLDVLKYNLYFMDDLDVLYCAHLGG